MSLHLVYIGAAAELAPAASLRALAGGGAVFVPPELPDDLCELISGALAADEATASPGSSPTVAAASVAGAGRHDGDAGAAATLLDPGDRDGLWARAAGRPDGACVCVAGPAGPALARALRDEASARGIPVTTTPDGSLFSDALIADELLSLKRIVDVLRVACPWDREQTARDIVSYSVEEVYELADAIAADDLEAEHGELGDLLLQVVLLALMLSERAAGDLGSVAHEIEVKLIRRHAHIFGDAVAETPGEVRGQWERIKRDQEGREGVFHDVPGAFPALLFARKVQQRAGVVGFDWDSAAEAFPKIAEEHGELAEVLGIDAGAAESVPAPGAGRGVPPSDEQNRRPVDDARLRHEFGDLLFAVVNVARIAGVDPELALRAASQRFVTRVEAAVELAAAEGIDWCSLPLEGQEEFYRRAKEDQTAADDQEGQS
jgi:NTP pyrophosphatase (non-canonical NTP hydrolase)